ncbi:hypothetical protein GCM10009642_53270 [Nocardiopsis metallicus]
MFLEGSRFTTVPHNPISVPFTATWERPKSMGTRSNPTKGARGPASPLHRGDVLQLTRGEPALIIKLLGSGHYTNAESHMDTLACKASARSARPSWGRPHLQR